MSKYPYLANFSATGHLEPTTVMFNVSSWRPYWNSRWQPIHPLVRPPGSGNFWTQHVKIPLYAKFHTFCRMWTCAELKISVPMVFRTKDSNHQCFVMVAMLEFKMVATWFVRHLRLIHCWTQQSACQNTLVYQISVPLVIWNPRW